ncbi:MAG: hypothetical protein GXZ13_07800 [Synergistaceae bacterium]|nr:hypothetical protein [Synergistaceae bacterium]
MTEEQRYRYWLAVHALADSEESATMTEGVNNGETQQTDYSTEKFCKKMVESA